MKWAGRLDMYRKIPAELMEGTKRGSALSMVAAAIMGLLFLMETGAYFSRTTVTQLQLDTNDEERVRLNFNITMMDLKCDFAVVDVVRCVSFRFSPCGSGLVVVTRGALCLTRIDYLPATAIGTLSSVLGTEQNVTSHVTKWNVDAAGVRQRYQGRNKQQKDIDLFDSTITQTLEQLHANGIDALSLDAETFEYARKTQEYLFVDFFASW
jgi:Endoplasmic Reticulum-Golgi Intermediate Compartment (ERGIC)